MLSTGTGTAGNRLPHVVHSAGLDQLGSRTNQAVAIMNCFFFSYFADMASDGSSAGLAGMSPSLLVADIKKFSRTRFVSWHRRNPLYFARLWLEPREAPVKQCRKVSSPLFSLVGSLCGL